MSTGRRVGCNLGEGTAAIIIRRIGERGDLGLPVGGLGATLGRASGRILFSKPSPEAAGLA